MPLCWSLVHCLRHAHLHALEYFHRIMLHPSKTTTTTTTISIRKKKRKGENFFLPGLRIVLGELNLVRSNTARLTVIDDESGAARALINGAYEGSLLCFRHLLIERDRTQKQEGERRSYQVLKKTRPVLVLVFRGRGVLPCLGIVDLVVYPSMKFGFTVIHLW